MPAAISDLHLVLPSDGLVMRGLRAGTPGGTPLLLLHGWPEWSHAWRGVMQRLPEGFDLVAPDLRGFGRTAVAGQQPDKGIGPARHAADMLELADVLGWRHYGVVSHDVGSFVAQVMARNDHARLSRLFFFDCAYPGIAARWFAPRHLPQIWYQFFHQLPWAAELVGQSRESCRLYFLNFLRHWSHQHHWIDGEIEAWVDNFMRPGALQGGFNWYLSVSEGRLAVVEGRQAPPPPIPQPTRVLWGERDPVLPATWTDRLPEFFSDLRLDLMPEVGHFPHLEQPERAASEIANWFTTSG